jgi:hypothetical protein
MRVALIASLILSGLTIVQVRAHRMAVKSQAATAFDVQTNEEKSVHWTVEGTWEKNKTDAIEEALVKAQEKVTAYLRGQNPPVEWTPSLPYIQTHLVKTQPWKEETKDFDQIGRMYRVQLEVEVTPSDLTKMVHWGREFRVHQRMFILAKVLAGLVVLLAAVSGYLRLDEYTKGYYTGWLRLAAVALVGAAGAGLVLIV